MPLDQYVSLIWPPSRNSMPHYPLGQHPERFACQAWGGHGALITALLPDFAAIQVAAQEPARTKGKTH